MPYCVVCQVSRGSSGPLTSCWRYRHGGGPLLLSYHHREVPASTRNTGGGVLSRRGWRLRGLLFLLPLLLLLPFQLLYQGGLFLVGIPGDDDLHLSGLGGSSPVVRLAVGLQKGWSLTHSVWAGMVRFQALLALD